MKQLTVLLFAFLFGCISTLSASNVTKTKDDVSKVCVDVGNDVDLATFEIIDLAKIETLRISDLGTLVIYANEKNESFSKIKNKPRSFCDINLNETKIFKTSFSPFVDLPIEVGWCGLAESN